MQGTGRDDTPKPAILNVGHWPAFNASRVGGGRPARGTHSENPHPAPGASIFPEILECTLQTRKTARRTQSSEAPVPKKRCSQCHKSKPLSEFWRRNDRPNGFESACKPCRSNDKLKSRQDNWLEYLVSAARVRARQSKLPFSLSRSWIDQNKATTVCALTGLKLTRVGRRDANNALDPLTPSLDRIDSSKGYTDQNTRIVCWWVNRAKGELSDAQFRLLISATASKMFH